MNNIVIDDNKLSALRQTVMGRMSEKRAIHTVAVEAMVVRLGQIYAPEKLNILRASALLHDITKEKKLDEQLELCEKLGISFDENDCFSPKIFHAKTAAAIIPIDFPDFACPEVISAVRWHTTGHKGMTLIEKLIYLADYIDESRQFDDCVYLRNMFWDAKPESMNSEERLEHLHTVLIKSFDLTVKALLEENSPVASDTFDARNELICEKLKANTLKG